MSKISKRLLIISASLILLVIIVVFSLALSNANKLIAQFKPQLEESISAAIGSKVSVGEIKASIFPETAFKITSLSLEQQQGQIVGPKFDELAISLDLSGLLQGELRIKEVLLKSPEIKFIKQDQTKPVGNSNTGQPVGAAADSASVGGKPKEIPLNINLDLFKIENGFFEFVDQAQSKNYKVSNIDLSSALSMQGKDIKLRDFTLTAEALEKLPVSFSLPELMLNANTLNLKSFILAVAEQKLNGAGDFDLSAKAGELKLNSTSFELNPVVSAAALLQPSLSAMELKGQISPDIEAKFEPGNKFNVTGRLGLHNIQTRQGQFEISDLGGDINLKVQSPDSLEAQSSNLGFKLNQQPGTLNFLLRHQDKKINIPDLQLNFLGGVLKSDLQFAAETKAFSNNLNISDIQISSVLSLLNKPDVPLSGKVSNIQASLQGILDAKPVQSLRGQARIKVIDGAFKGFNLAGIVLKAVNNLPFLTGSLYSSLPASERAAFDSSDTAFSEMTGSLNFAGQGISVQSLNLQAPVFSVEAKGSVGFDSSLDLKATIYFSKAFSSTLVLATDKLKYVLDDQGRLVVPLTLTGVAPKVVVLPDLQKLIELSGKKVLTEKAGDIAKGLLQNKKLGSLFGF